MKNIKTTLSTLILTFMVSNPLLGVIPAQTTTPRQGAENKDKNDSIFPAVNVDVIQGRWNELKGKIKKRWGKMTDDDLLQIEGSFQEIHGILQAKYGYDKLRSEKEIKEFLKMNNLDRSSLNEGKPKTP